MSDLIRRSALSDLGSYLMGLVSTWPRRNRHYGELQEGISKAVIDHSTLVGQDTVSALNRRQALMSLGLVPVRLSGGLPITDAKKADTDILLAHCAAGIAACWYLRRGKDLIFVSDLVSSYISILQPLIYPLSGAYRKASATLLGQCLRLKGSLARNRCGDDLAFIEQSLESSIIAEDPLAQALAYRQRGISHWLREDYSWAVADAEQAASLVNSQTNTVIQSDIYSGMATSLAANGQIDLALSWLKKALNAFDPTVPVPVDLQFSSAILCFNSGLVYRDSGQWDMAAKSFDQAITSPDASALGKVQASIERATIEAYRDDQERNMDTAQKLWEQGMGGAKELDSKRYINIARKAYPILVAAWPTEDSIKKLRKQYL